jgi:hypothetical protein
MKSDKNSSPRNPDKKWFDLANTVFGVVLGFVLGLAGSYFLQKSDQHRNEAAIARILAFSTQAELSRISRTENDISNLALNDKSFHLYPSSFNALHDIELLNSLKPSIGELSPEVVEAFVKYEFETRQCALFRDNVEQSLHKEMDAGNTNRNESDQFLKAYAWSLEKLDEGGTNLLQKIQINYPHAIKP